MSALPVMGEITLCHLMDARRRMHHYFFCDLVPKMHYQYWTIRKYQANQNRGLFFKIIASNCQKFQGYKCRCKTVELFHIERSYRDVMHYPGLDHFSVKKIIGVNIELNVEYQSEYHNISMLILWLWCLCFHYTKYISR